MKERNNKLSQVINERFEKVQVDFNNERANLESKIYELKMENSNLITKLENSKAKLSILEKEKDKVKDSLVNRLDKLIEAEYTNKYLLNN